MLWSASRRSTAAVSSRRAQAPGPDPEEVAPGLRVQDRDESDSELGALRMRDHVRQVGVDVELRRPWTVEREQRHPATEDRVAARRLVVEVPRERQQHDRERGRRERGADPPPVLGLRDRRRHERDQHDADDPDRDGADELRARKRQGEHGPEAEPVVAAGDHPRGRCEGEQREQHRQRLRDGTSPPSSARRDSRRRRRARSSARAGARVGAAARALARARRCRRRTGRSGAARAAPACPSQAPRRTGSQARRGRRSREACRRLLPRAAARP